MTAAREGRILRIAGGSYEVKQGDETHECILAGRLKQGRGDRIAVGDRVRVERLEEGPSRITEILPRRGKLARRAMEEEREQVIVANLDQLGAVFATEQPEPDLAMLDRLLVVAELNGLHAFVVANKVDLSPAEDRFAPQRSAGYDVLPTSAVEGAGLDDLRERLRDRTTALAGPSGAGKTSLLNRMIAGLDRRVAGVSGPAGRGRHTTVNATLLPLPDGSWVADTPGLQYMELWELAPDELASAFPEFRPLLGTCRFNDCRHVEEPDCGIREALEAGDIHAERYRSYRKLLEEAEERSRSW